MLKISPREIARTGDDAPARSVFGYTLRMSGRHQLWVGLLAILGAGVGLVPIELQRRIIDNAIGGEDATLLTWLGGLYFAVVVVQQAMKFALKLAQGWLSESAVFYTRRHILGLLDPQQPSKEPGERVAVLTAEIDQLGGFVGEGPSNAAANVATLLGVLAYTFTIEPRIAVVGLALLIPQVALAPLLQRKINRLLGRRVSLMRRFGGRVAALDTSSPDEIGEIYQNRMRIHLWKAVLKAALNLSNQLAPLGILLVGGFMVMAGNTTLGVLVAFTSGFERMSAPARELIAFYRRAQQAEVQHAMIASWMTAHHAPRDALRHTVSGAK